MTHFANVILNLPKLILRGHPARCAYRLKEFIDDVSSFGIGFVFLCTVNIPYPDPTQLSVILHINRLLDVHAR